MNKLTDFLAGTRILEEKNSKINGQLTVIKDIAWGTYIKGGGLTQSGGVAKKVWNTSISSVKNHKIKSALILGLGGGSIAELIHKFWPKAIITGVDIDPIIVDLGKKHLNLSKDKVSIVITDAYKYITSSQILDTKYDLICIDTYVGDQYPKKLENKKFINLVKNNLTKNGVAIFNRLYYGDKRGGALRFQKNLEEIFPKVKIIHPDANIMFLCS